MGAAGSNPHTAGNNLYHYLSHPNMSAPNLFLVGLKPARVRKPGEWFGSHSTTCTHVPTMPFAKLTITIPDDIWIGTISRLYPDMQFRVLAATATDENGHIRVEIIGPQAATVCEDIRSQGTVTDVTVFDEGPHRRRVQVATTEPVLLTALQQSGVPLKLPFEASDGSMTFEAILTQDQLSRLGKTLEEFELPYGVEQIRPERESKSLLTDRQRWLLHQAIDRGYYDTPRRISLVELADEVDIAKSTCSEILHRAEGQVLKRFVSGECEHSPDIPIRAD